MDDSIGRTLAVLEELELEKDTVIIFHADHGCAQARCFESIAQVCAMR
jgi:arylsulfatase A-like enzyme